MLFQNGFYSPFKFTQIFPLFFASPSLWGQLKKDFLCPSQPSVQSFVPFPGQLGRVDDQQSLLPRDFLVVNTSLLLSNPFKAQCQRFGIAGFTFTFLGFHAFRFNPLQVLSAFINRNQQLLHNLADIANLSQGRKIKVIPCLYKGSRLQCAHLGVPDIQPATGSHNLSSASESGQVEGIVGAVARHHQRGHRQSQGIKRTQHHFKLRQIWTMIFAMAFPEKGLTLLIVVDRDRRAVQPYPISFEIIHPDKVLTQLTFYFVPYLIFTEQTQHIGQSVIGEIFDPHGMGDQVRQTLLMICYPPFNLHHPMIALGHDVRQPPGGQPTHTETLTVAVRPDYTIQDLGNAHFLLLGYKQRDIVYPFGINLGFWCHTRSMTQFRFLRNK